MTQISLNARRLAVSGVAIVVVVLVAVLAVNAGRADAVGPDPAPSTETSMVTCRTDAAGYCTVPHALGAEPESVLLTPKLYRGMPYLLGLASSSSTELRVRAAISPTHPLGRVTIEFSYAVFATAATPPTTTTTDGPPPTTTTTSAMR